ncbi:MAG: hypothetical protein NTX25_17705 [Proteobacteria bacterium]|nr:hypothetical protein [Pseudomonadota bacterium]
MRALILVTGLFTFACSHFGESTSEQGSEPAINAASSAVHAPAPLNAAEFELRLAKLWARVDELENHQIRQRERMKLLEKGLLLGLIPEDLKADKSDHKRTAQNQEAEGEKNSDLPKDVPSTVVKAPSTEPIAGEKSRDIA